MKNADMPAMPLYDVIEDCGIDGNQGPYLVSRTETGLTKREHFAAMAMQGILSNPRYFREIQNQAVELDCLGHDCDTGKLVSELSYEYADDLLAAQERR